MAVNRLFLYDEETNSAVCIAKGFSSGWYTGNGDDNVNNFFDNIEEYPGELKDGATKLSLKTEDNLPKDCKCFWADKG